MGRSFKKFANVVKEAQMRWMFREGDGAPTVAIECGVKGETVKEGQPVLKGTRLLFQQPRTIRMLLAPKSDGRALVVHLLEAALVKLESMLKTRAREEAAANPRMPTKAQQAPIHADTYAGNDLGPIGMGDWVTRKGQTERYQVTAMRVLNGTMQAKTDRPKSRWTNVDRFEHAREVTPEPAAADMDPALFQQFLQFQQFLASQK